MIEIVRFDPAHIGQLDVQPAQAGELDVQRMVSEGGQAWTALAHGAPICCAGLQQMWPGRAYAWAVLARCAGAHMVSLTRAIRFRLAGAPFHRIEMAVAADFWPGVRWAQMLGFEMECKARRLMPDGGDAWVFVRV